MTLKKDETQTVKTSLNRAASSMKATAKHPDGSTTAPAIYLEGTEAAAVMSEWALPFWRCCF